ncbi:GNAT family N-acetyltransferase [Bacillus tequilensis]|nr:GNAT family N-acetyltransferase [Bacillus tequilensis]
MQLEPLERGHVTALRTATDDALAGCWYSSVPAPDAMESYVDAALQMQAEGRALAFVVRDSAGAVVGSTRFYDLSPGTPRLHIGYTWYARRVQRTGLNTEAKRLLLGHAFGNLGCVAVGFKTSWFNHASRASIERLGAKQDGVIRNHMRHADGSLRDTVLYSIIEAEWPAVRSHLDARLAAHGARETGA